MVVKTAEEYIEKLLAKINNNKLLLEDLNEQKKVINLLQKSNNSLLYYTLAYFYETGKYVDKDINKAIYWYKKAGFLGYENAFYALVLIYYNKDIKDYHIIIHYLKKLIKLNNSEAMRNFGLMYYKGEGVVLNIKKALYWLEKAAQLNNIVAMFNLGCIYYSNEKVKQDINKSLYWLEKAANLKSIQAIKKLISIYTSDDSTIKDVEKAIYWYEQAVKLNDNDSMFELGCMFHFGNNIEQDFEKAVYWYEQAANLGNKNAMFFLGYIYSQIEYIGNDIDKSVYWYEQAANLGDDKAMLSLGHIYQYNKNINRDIEKAIYWYTLSANNKNSKAMQILGYIYQKGIYVEKDINKTIYWYELAANNNNVNAMYNLGLMYYIGNEVEKDYIKAISWLEKAATLNDNEAMFLLGRIYSEKGSITQDSEKQDYWFLKAAIHGNSNAMNNVAITYLNIDLYDSAIYWLEKAIEQNNVYAYINLARVYANKNYSQYNLNKALVLVTKAIDLGYEQARELYLEIKEQLQTEKEKYLHIGKRKDIFISWNHFDKELKDDIVNFIELKGIITCWDSDGDCNGDIIESCLQAIDNSSSFMVLITKNALKSKYMGIEINHVLNKIAKGEMSKNCVKPLFYNVNEEINKLIETEPNNPFVRLYQINIGSPFIDGKDINIEKIYSNIKSMLIYSQIRKYQISLINRYNKFRIFLASNINRDNDRMYFLNMDTNPINNCEEKTNSNIIKTTISYENGYVNRLLNGNIKEEEVIKNKISFIYGEGGCGKSLYISQIVRKLMHKENKVFFVSTFKEVYNKLKNDNVTMYDILRELFYTVSFNTLDNIQGLPEASFNELIPYNGGNSNNDLIIILDAIDELELHEHYLFVLNKIDEFMNLHSNVKLVFLSRNLEDASFLDHPVIYNIKPFNSEEMNILIKNIFMDITNNKNDYSYFLEQLNKIDNDIKQNPLLLSNLIIIYLKEDTIPTKKYEIIEKSIAIIIDDVEADRNVTFKFVDILEHTKQILEHLAFYQFQNPSLSTYEMLKIIFQDIGITGDIDFKAQEYTKYLRRRLIIRNNSFYHAFFKDYFTARYFFHHLYEYKLTILKEKDLQLVINENTKMLLLIDYVKGYFSKEQWVNAINALIVKLDYECRDNKYRNILSNTLEILNEYIVYRKVFIDINELDLYNKDFFINKIKTFNII